MCTIRGVTIHRKQDSKVGRRETRKKKEGCCLDISSGVCQSNLWSLDGLTGKTVCKPYII